jgi:hypothetical protein
MKGNILRGILLDLMRKMYPEGIDYRTIITILYQYHKVDAISDSLEYLADKEYVQKKTAPHPYAEQETVCWYKITPKGIDLLEGNIESDPGILIQRK